MKHFLLVFVCLSISTQAFADEKILDCRVAKVYDDNVFEEGLSNHEYPDVDVTRVGIELEVSIGAMQNYETKSGDVVVFDKNTSGVFVRAKYKDSDQIVEISVSRNQSERGEFWGRLKVREDQKSELSDVALLLCK